MPENIKTLKIPYSFTFLPDSKSLNQFLHTDSSIFISILDNLKQYEPFCIPFLSKVIKRDVPIYYDVIANPMDLGTMTKKKYTIESFKKDLDLIWSNCYYFNGESIFSEYAAKMQERADFLFDYYFGTEKIEKENKEENCKILNRVLPEMKINKNGFSIFDKKNDILVKQEDLTFINFDYRNIKIGKNSCYNKCKKYDKKVILNDKCVKRIFEEIIIAIFSKIGYGKVEKNAMKLFGDVVYNLVYCKMKHHDSFELKKEIKEFKLEDLNIACIKDENYTDDD
ncbi:Transcriptional activator spt7 [Gurleya vavrai]